MVRITRVDVWNGRGPWLHLQVLGVTDKGSNLVGNAEGCSLEEIQNTTEKIITEMIKTENHVSIHGNSKAFKAQPITVRQIKAE